MTFAQLVSGTNGQGGIVGIVNGQIIPLLFALAFIFFMINIVRYVFIEGGDEGRKKGRDAMIYGMIGLVLLFSIWGILNLLLNTLNSAVGGVTH